MGPHSCDPFPIDPIQQQQPTITTPTSKQLQQQQANKRKSSGKSSISSAHASTEEPISHGKPLRLKKSGKTGRKICSNCGVIKTPVWRKGPLGTGTLCNACGLKYSLGTITLDPETGAVPGKQSFLEIVSDTNNIKNFFTVNGGVQGKQSFVVIV